MTNIHLPLGQLSIISWVFLVFLYTNVVLSQTAINQECPRGWVDYDKSCYRFMRLNSLKDTYSIFNQDRSQLCRNYNAQLVSVNSYNENKFIIDWLQNNDPHKRTWLSSGQKDSTSIWRWTGDQSNLNNIVDLWLPKEAQSNATFSSNSLRASYKFHAPSGKWGLSQVLANDVVTGVICEVLKNKLFMSTDKNIDYGQEVYDKGKIERGPKIVQEPEDVIFDISGRSQSNQVKLSCLADAYPEPEYKWFRYESSNENSEARVDIDVLTDNRFTLTDGTLIISNPQSETDRAQYQCLARNRYGTVISKKITLQFGYITEFVKKRSPERGQENFGKALSCDAPSRRPSTLNYYWSRSEFPNFVTEGPRIFISHDGNLYFSSLEKIDRANYSCNVQSVISSTGRTGPPFPLYVDSGNSGQKLQFANDFPKVFPEGPLAGQEVRLECMAYGYPTPSYNWTRIGSNNRLPDQFKILNDGKVLSLPKIKIEDDGEYMCTAILDSYFIQKSVYISVQAAPKFTQPLEDQILSLGDTMTLICEAFGLPTVTYSWYKDGQDMSIILDSRYIINNSIDKLSILSVNSVNMYDAGMYQCAATNQHGNTFSTAQVKVGELKMNFNRYGLKDTTFAMVGQEVTLACAPEGLPQPTKIEWYKNGQPLFNRELNYYSRNIEKLKNNFLFIKNLTLEDDGRYECIASQAGILGDLRDTVRAKTSTWLTVMSKPMDTYRLSMRELAKYGDAFKVLPCEVVGGKDQEISRVWYKNGIKINFESNNEKYSKSDTGSLVLRNITYTDDANYTCNAKTSVGSIDFNGRLIVDGPPDPCGQVIAEILGADRARIIWTDGFNHGSRILYHVIEAKTNYNSTWTIIANKVFDAPVLKSSTTVRMQFYRRFYEKADLLLPNTQYTFRVSSANEYGLGEPSSPSPQYRTEASIPRYAVTNLTGGGGKSGTLVIRWDPLPRSLWGDDEIWYLVQYKKNESQDYERQELRSAGNRSVYTISVGTDNSYKQYNVAVYPVNRLGEGPPTRTNIYSAQTMPNIQPSNVYAIAFNSTSLNVTWTPIVEDIPENSDKVVGYRIKYWPNKRNPQTDSLTTVKRGLKNWGLLVGLMPDTEYQLVVMAYNDAGSGPQSESFRIKTFKSAPLRPPTSVEVSLTLTSATVRWRGVSTVSTDEEPIIGYKVRYWRTNENISKAKVILIPLGGKELTATIYDLIRGEEYKLRVLAYSAGGDGKMSSPETTIKF